MCGFWTRDHTGVYVAVTPAVWILERYSTGNSGVQSPESMVPSVNYAAQGMSLLETLVSRVRGVVCCLIQHLDLVLFYLVVVVPGMLCNGRFLQLSPSTSRLVLFHPGLKGSLRFSYIDMATAARDLVYDIGLLLEWILIFNLHQLPVKGG